MNKIINFDGLHHYTISKSGGVFHCSEDGEQEIRGCLAEQNTVIIPLTPHGHRFPKPFNLQNLYFETYGKHLPKCAVDSYMPAKERIGFKSFLLVDKNGDKIIFTKINHAADFLHISDKALSSAIRNKSKIKGFYIYGNIHGTFS